MVRRGATYTGLAGQRRLVDLCELENFINFLSRNVLPRRGSITPGGKRGGSEGRGIEGNVPAG